MSGAKGVSRSTRSGKVVIVKAGVAKVAGTSGQRERIETLRRRRAERVKQALSRASSNSALFRLAG